MRKWITLAVALVVAAAVAVPALAATPTRAHAKRGKAPLAPALVGTTGPGFTITLKIAGKTKVVSLKAGKYTFTIRDLSAIHNFHLMGPGVNKVTPLAGKGTFHWVLTLKKGTYRYICDPHAAIMKGSFKVK